MMEDKKQFIAELQAGDKVKSTFLITRKDTKKDKNDKYFCDMELQDMTGKIAGKIGAKSAILLGLLVYTGIAIGGYFLQTALHFWILAVLVGSVQGGTQALSRSLFGTLIPKSRSAEFYSFYDVSSKFAGIIGPALFGIVGQMTGSSRLSIVSLVIFFVVGGLLLTTVDVKKGRAMVA